MSRIDGVSGVGNAYHSPQNANVNTSDAFDAIKGGMQMFQSQAAWQGTMNFMNTLGNAIPPQSTFNKALSQITGDFNQMKPDSSGNLSTTDIAKLNQDLDNLANGNFSMPKSTLAQVCSESLGAAYTSYSSPQSPEDKETGAGLFQTVTGAIYPLGSNQIDCTATQLSFNLLNNNPNGVYSDTLQLQDFLKDMQ